VDTERRLISSGSPFEQAEHALQNISKALGSVGMGLEDVDRTVALIDRVRAGRTVVMVEHNMSVVGSLADTVTVLQRGRVLVEGPYETVRADPRVIEAYLGADVA